MRTVTVAVVMASVRPSVRGGSTATASVTLRDGGSVGVGHSCVCESQDLLLRAEGPTGVRTKRRRRQSSRFCRRFAAPELPGSSNAHLCSGSEDHRERSQHRSSPSTWRSPENQLLLQQMCWNQRDVTPPAARRTPPSLRRVEKVHRGFSVSMTTGSETFIISMASMTRENLRGPSVRSPPSHTATNVTSHDALQPCRWRCSLLSADWTTLGEVSSLPPFLRHHQKLLQRSSNASRSSPITPSSASI